MTEPSACLKDYVVELAHDASHCEQSKSVLDRLFVIWIDGEIANATEPEYHVLRVYGMACRRLC